jgi:hypothetical protein
MSNSETADPVMVLAERLRYLWAVESVVPSDKDNDGLSDEKRVLSGRKAVETQIAFEQATSVSGALVQITLAVDFLEDVLAIHQQRATGNLAKHVSDIDLLLRSAARAIRQIESPDTSAAKLLKHYAIENDWHDLADKWAKAGSEPRNQDAASA